MEGVQFSMRALEQRDVALLSEVYRESENQSDFQIGLADSRSSTKPNGRRWLTNSKEFLKSDINSIVLLLVY